MAAEINKKAALEDLMESIYHLSASHHPRRLG
jgi:hypothetical protein